MKSKSIWLLVLIGILTYSYGAEKQVNMKKPVELVFDTKVSCKDVKPYLEFIDKERKKNKTEPTKTICSNDDTDGKLSIIDKDTDNPKIVHEPTNTVFQQIVIIDGKKYGTAEDYKAYLVPKGIAYADLDDDGEDEIFIAGYSEYNFFLMQIIKNSGDKLSLFDSVIKVDGGKIMILPSKTKGFHDILFQDSHRKRKYDAIWKYVGNLKYN